MIASLILWHLAWVGAWWAHRHQYIAWWLEVWRVLALAVHRRRLSALHHLSHRWEASAWWHTSWRHLASVVLLLLHHLLHHFHVWWHAAWRHLALATHSWWTTSTHLHHHLHGLWVHSLWLLEDCILISVSPCLCNSLARSGGVKRPSRHDSFHPAHDSFSSSTRGRHELLHHHSSLSVVGTHIAHRHLTWW